MKKFAIIILGLALTAASCDINSLFDLGSAGVRGVLKSEDNAQTFLPANGGNVTNNISANVLVFEPGNPETLYLGYSGGLYKSEDAAKTWKHILSGLNTYDIGIDPFHPNILYAAGISGQNGKIVKSTDSGTSWTDIYNEPSKSNAVLSIAVSRVNSSMILAGLTNGEIIRSQDSGNTWQATKDFSDRLVQIKFGSNGTAYALAVHKGLQKSTDFGLTWTGGSNVLSNQTISTVGESISSVSAFYDLALDSKQPGVVYLGTEQGLYRTVDDGVSWSPLALPVKNASLKVTAVAVDPINSNDVLVAIASTIFKSVNGGITWETRVLPTNNGVKRILINPLSTNVIYLGMGSN